MSHICGALASPGDPRDWIYEGMARGKLLDTPEEFSLMEYLGPLKDQGPRGTCAAFVGAGVRSIQHHRATGANVELSAEFIYFNRDNKPASGMFGRNVFSILYKMGTPPESFYPYGTKKNPTESVREIASNFRISSYARIISAEGLRLAVYEIGPCYLLLPLYSARPEFWRSGPGENCEKCHAVLVVGFNSQGFVLVNSWGEDWNDTGTVILPYEDYSATWECWVTMNDEVEEQMASSESPKKSRRSKYRRLNREGNGKCVIQ